MTRTIEIIVAPDGKTTVQTRGFTGGKCREASKFIEETLGSRVAENLTAEFYQQHEAEQQAEQRR